MLLLDLAVPRDIAPDVATLKDAFLYTVDDLERAIEDNRQSRREAADAAEVIVDLQVSRYVALPAARPRNAPPKRLDRKSGGSGRSAPGRAARGGSSLTQKKKTQ